MSIHYEPGPDFALVRPGLVVLVDASVDAAVVADLWAAVVAADVPARGGGAGLATVLDAVTAVLDPTWRTLPAFAVAIVEAGTAQVAVRGAFAARVTTSESTEDVSGPTVVTWVDKKIDGVLHLELGTGTGTGTGAGDGAGAALVLAISDGIVLVERLRWEVDRATEGAGAGRGENAGSVAVLEGQGGEGQSDAEGQDGADVRDGADGLGTTGGPEGAVPPENLENLEGLEGFEGFEDLDGAAEDGTGPQAQTDDGVRDEDEQRAVSDLSATGGPEHILSPVQQTESDFARTLAGFPEEWHEEQPEPDADADADVDVDFDADAAVEVDVDASASANADADLDNDFDDTTLFVGAMVSIKNSMPPAAPWAPPAGSMAPPAPRTSHLAGSVPPPPPPPHAQVTRATQASPAAQAAHGGLMPPSGPSLGSDRATPPAAPHGPRPVEPFRAPAVLSAEVLARTCFFGHLNPPTRMACAQCGGGLSPTAQLVERPSLGRVEVSTGESVDLSVPVVVGRFPQAQTTGSPVAQRLVTVPSPSQDISRSHLEIRLDGWHVLLVDLDTVNGTTLLRAGQSPRRLHPLEPTLVADGDVVDLGDGVTLSFRELV